MSAIPNFVFIPTSAFSTDEYEASCMSFEQVSPHSCCRWEILDSPSSRRPPFYPRRKSLDMTSAESCFQEEANIPRRWRSWHATRQVSSAAIQSSRDLQSGPPTLSCRWKFCLLNMWSVTSNERHSCRNISLLLDLYVLKNAIPKDWHMHIIDSYINDTFKATCLLYINLLSQ